MMVVTSDQIALATLMRTRASEDDITKFINQVNDDYRYAIRRATITAKQCRHDLNYCALNVESEIEA